MKKRRELLNQEAMANLGGAIYEDYEDLPTEEIDSEEGDLFLRKKHFEELVRRFDKHRRENYAKGNDLKWHTYLNKINRMAKQEMGIDVEGYKDYLNTLEKFKGHLQESELLQSTNYHNDMDRH